MAVAVRDYLTKQGMRLVQDPRLGRVFQNDRVVKVLIGALELRGRLQEEVDQRVELLARSLNLATKRELRELKRTLRRVEQELERERRRADSRGA